MSPGTLPIGIRLSQIGDGPMRYGVQTATTSFSCIITPWAGMLIPCLYYEMSFLTT
jgi:hypothetical protein